MTKVELLERIAQLIVAETPMDQIALVLGMTELEVAQLKDTAECKRQIAIIMGEKLEDEQNMNDGWDSVENQAIHVVLDNLKWNKDPRFALQAASMANKAVRRGKRGNQSLEATNAGRAVINLQMNFIKHLEKSTQQTVSTDAVQLQKKMVDCMEPTKIEKLLDRGVSKSKSQLLNEEDLLPEFDLAMSV